jgi:ATP-dependent helicase HrpA
VELVIGEVAGLPLLGYPGLLVEGGEVHLRIFRSAAEAGEATASGWPRLAERVLASELKGLQSDLRCIRRHGELLVTLGSVDELLETAWQHVRTHLFPAPAVAELKREVFEAYLSEAQQRIPGIVAEVDRGIEAVLRARHEALLFKRPFPGMRAALDELVPMNFLVVTPHHQLSSLPRYIRALVVRADRASVSPAKDRQKQERVSAYEQALREMRQEAAKSSNAEVRGAADRFRWLLEEYRVSVFAQELGTAIPVSAQRLDEALAGFRRLTGE